MAVLIEGMEMPTSCANCDLAKHFDGYNENDCPFNCFSYYDCPLIPVPEPHGDLIEKQAVFKLISAFPEIDKLLTVEFMKALYNLSTVIPASEEIKT